MDNTNNLKIRVNSDKEYVDGIRERLKENDGYFPCRIKKDITTKCMCKEFREQTTEGYCHCGLYYKEF
jgi:hypothetical protein